MLLHGLITKKTLEAINNIIGVLTKWTEDKVPVNPEAWIDAGLKLNVLKEDTLIAPIIALQSSLAQKRYNLLQEGKTSAYAKTAVEADPEYAELKKLEATCKFIEEHIRLTKVRARLATDDYNSR